MHARRPPTYTVQLPKGGEVNEIQLRDITDYVSTAELERFEHRLFTKNVDAQAPEVDEHAVQGFAGITENKSSSIDRSPLSTLRSSLFNDYTPPRSQLPQSPNSKRNQAYNEALSRQYGDVGIFETAPGKYEAAIKPAGIHSSIKWMETDSLVTARTIETGVDENPEIVAYIAQSGELIVADTGNETQQGEQWGAIDKADNTRGIMPAHKQKNWVLMPLVPASKESCDFIGVSSVVEVKKDDLTAYVEVQRHPLMNPATAIVVGDLYLELEGHVGKLVGQFTSILIEKSILSDGGMPAWLNRGRGLPPLPIDIFDGEGRALAAFKEYAPLLEQNGILIMGEFWLRYDTPDVAPEDSFFAALPYLDNGYAFRGTALVAPTQLKNPANEKSLIEKWKKSGFEVWQEWKEEKAPLGLGRAWQQVSEE